MVGDLFVIGLSWRTAPVALRERLAFGADEIVAALAGLRESPSIGEAVLLATCNRVEVYGATPKSAPGSALAAATAEVRRYLGATRQVDADELAAALYEHADRDAIRHLLRVAASLDSMVLGEAQILGQLKSAYGVAVKAGAAGPLLARCMEHAFAVAKRVRTSTGIGQGAANVSSVAVDLARRVFGDLVGKNVLIVGAGKMSDLAARHLRADGAGALWVANRSLAAARELAERVQGVARPWSELAAALTGADVIISSTGAAEPILTPALIKSAMKARKYRPLLVIDIAVPRDADPDIGRIDGVYLFDIDDLERVVAENLRLRAREAEEATRIIDGEVQDVQAWIRGQSAVPTIRALRDRFTSVAQAEADQAIASLAAADSPEKREQAVRRLADRIVGKLLHAPMTALKRGEDELEVEALSRATRQLFDLGDTAPDANAPDGEPAAAMAAESKPRGPV
jgi:glutamyl-tRNA reductase